MPQLWTVLLLSLLCRDQQLRPCPHVAGYLGNGVCFNTLRPVIHMKLQFYVSKNNLCWKTYPKWRFWKTLVSCIRRGKLRQKNPLTSHTCDICWWQAWIWRGWALQALLFSCVLLHLKSKTTFESNSTSFLVQTKYLGAMFESLVEETEWQGLILIGWHGFHIWKTPPGMGLACLKPYLLADMPGNVCFFFGKLSGVDKSTF